jgi:hypothetical protein
LKPSDQLVELAKRAEAKLSEVFDVPAVLPFASEAVDLARTHPDSRHDFENEFTAMRALAPVEFVQVCMHALRWPNLRTIFEERSRLAIEQNDWSAIADYGKYLDAFEDDWKDAWTFYSSFWQDGHPLITSKNGLSSRLVIFMKRSARSSSP